MRFARPRFDWRFPWWSALLFAGLLSSFSLSLAVGFGDATRDQAMVLTARDGSRSSEPFNADQLVLRPLRASRSVVTGHGILTVTIVVATEGTALPIPGIPVAPKAGVILVSTGLRSLLESDSDLAIWLEKPDTISLLPNESLASPDELVALVFEDTPRSNVDYELLSRSAQPIRSDTSFVYLGFAILMPPSLALIVSATGLTLQRRKGRYSLMRLLGSSPRAVARSSALDFLAPILAGSIFGVLGYRLITQLLGVIRIGEVEYWASGLSNSLSGAAFVIIAIVVISAVASVRAIRFASGRPLEVVRGAQRRERGWLAILVIAGGVVFSRALRGGDYENALLFTLAIVLVAIGSLGVASLVAKVLGSLLSRTSVAPVTSSRMRRRPTASLLGISATSIAIFLVVFMLVANFDSVPRSVGKFDYMVEVNALSSESTFPPTDLSPGESITRVGRFGVRVDGRETTLYTMSCADLERLAKVSISGGKCVEGTLLSGLQGFEGRSVNVVDNYPGPSSNVQRTYLVAGSVEALWLRPDGLVLVAQPELSLQAPYSLYLLDVGLNTDLSQALIEYARTANVFVSTRAGLELGNINETRVVRPFLIANVTATIVLAIITLFISAVRVLAERSKEFALARVLGGSRRRVSVDVGLMFFLPLMVALVTGIGLGYSLGSWYNSERDVVAPSSFLPSLIFWVSVVSSACLAVVIFLGSRLRATVLNPETIV